MDHPCALERFICLTVIILMLVIVILECEYRALDTAFDCNIFECNKTTYYNLTLNVTEGF